MAGSRAALLLLTFTSMAAATVGATGSSVLWEDNDNLPIAEPAEDDEGDYLWWDGAWSMTFYQLGKILDLGEALRTAGSSLGMVGPHEAANVNALDEVPDSTWFTNRHALRRLSADELARGPNLGPPPSADGVLTVLSGKTRGMTPGFVLQDAKGNRYVIKLDAEESPEIATGAEVVCSKIIYALGWNAPEYHLFTFDPARLVIGKDAWVKDDYNRKVPLTVKRLTEMVQRAARLPDGRIRALASRFIPGVPKGPFRTLGVRRDDPNDTVPHQDRRELRGLRIVAAWINLTDARRGNSYDAFVRSSDDPKSGGHLRHYLLDFSSALGSGNIGPKDPKLGNEYYFDPPKVGLRILTLGFWKTPWQKLPLTHPALGYFESSIFDPRSWRTSYPNPLFDQATTRDSFWGAKLVTSFTDDDLRVVVHSGEWSDPRAEDLLFRILHERQERIARAYLDSRKINPADRFTATGESVRYRDLAVDSRVADPDHAVYRYRASKGEWIERRAPRVPISGESPGNDFEVETSHDDGEHWSPATRIGLEGGGARARHVIRIERQTREGRAWRRNYDLASRSTTRRFCRTCATRPQTSAQRSPAAQPARTSLG